MSMMNQKLFIPIMMFAYAFNSIMCARILIAIWQRPGDFPHALFLAVLLALWGILSTWGTGVMVIDAITALTKYVRGRGTKP